MAFSRSAVLRSCFRGTRLTATRPHLFRQIARRGYASESHGSKKAGGDALWAAAAVGVTVPVCWYLLSNRPDLSHGHDDHGESHGTSHGGEHEDKLEHESEDEPKQETVDESKAEEPEKKTDDKDSEKSEDHSSGDENNDTETPETSEDEGDNTKSSLSDAKGNKKKISSNNSIKAGEDAVTDGDDKASASKDPGGKNTQSGKQEGVTNTDTKHSTDISSDPGSSTGDGQPKSGKLKGTVDPIKSQKEEK